jgi:hypothetical protein
MYIKTKDGWKRIGGPFTWDASNKHTTAADIEKMFPTNRRDSAVVVQSTDDQR